MTDRWWTCGCGERQKSVTFGRPFCSSCGKQASFSLGAPVGQTGFGFGAADAADDAQDDGGKVGAE